MLPTGKLWQIAYDFTSLGYVQFLTHSAVTGRGYDARFSNSRDV